MSFEEEDGRFDPKNKRNPGPILKIKVFGPLGLLVVDCAHTWGTQVLIEVELGLFEVLIVHLWGDKQPSPASCQSCPCLMPCAAVHDMSDAPGYRLARQSGLGT